jgi:hypothetical protein
MSKATITVLRPREELERLWREHEPIAGATFTEAPGDPALRSTSPSTAAAY